MAIAKLGKESQGSHKPKDNFCYPEVLTSTCDSTRRSTNWLLYEYNNPTRGPTDETNEEYRIVQEMRNDLVSIQQQGFDMGVEGAPNCQAIIKGPLGSGKSAGMGLTVTATCMLGAVILVTAHSHTAVNVLMEWIAKTARQYNRPGVLGRMA